MAQLTSTKTTSHTKSNMHDTSCRNPSQYSLNTPSDYATQLDLKRNKIWYIPPSVSRYTLCSVKRSQVSTKQKVNSDCSTLQGHR